MARRTVRKVTLNRGEQTLVIQGMTHVASATFYARVKKEMQDMEHAGYQVFYEEIKGRFYAGAGSTKAQQAVADFLRGLITGFYNKDAKSRGLVRQEKKIQYSKSAINADVSFKTAVQELIDQGIFVSRAQLSLFTDERCYSAYENKYTQAELEADPKLQHYVNQFRSRGVKELIHETLSILVSFRNVKAVAILEEYFARRIQGKALLHYGNAHLKGIVELLKKDGFIIVNHQEVGVSALGK